MYSVPVDLDASSWMGSQKANDCGFPIPVGHAVPAGRGYSVGGHVMILAACSADRPGHVEVDPCRRVGSGSDQVSTCNHETGS